MAVMTANIGHLTGYVNADFGHLTGCTGRYSRSDYRPMDLAAVVQRIEARLKAVRLSADAASRLAGTPDAIRNMRRAVKDGKRQGVTTATLAALAPVLETTVGYLMDGDEQPTAAALAKLSARPVAIQVIGRVAAGVFREVIEYEEGEREYVYDEPDPDFPKAKRFGLIVEGDSMNRLEPRPILDGDRVVCVDFDDTGLPLEHGAIVAVERSDGHLREWSVKQVELHGTRTEFHPRSSNPRWKPIVVEDDPDAEEQTVRVIGLVRSVNHTIPRSPALRRRP